MSAPPTKIFVGRLPVDAKSEDLRALFEKFGIVTECDVLNRFGFVHMKTEDMAKKAIEALHNSEFMGTKITVEPSTGKKGAGGGGGRPGPGHSMGGRPGMGGRSGGRVGGGPGRPTPYDRPHREDRYASPRNGGGYYEEYDYYPRRSAASSFPPSRDPYGPPPPYERRGPYESYERYPSERDRRPPPPMGGSSYDRRMMDYPPPRGAPDYRRRTPPPVGLGDSYGGGRYERDMYDAPAVDPYSSKRYAGAAPLDRDLPPRRY